MKYDQKPYTLLEVKMDLLNNEIEIEEIKEILMTAPADKTKEDLKILQEYFQDHDFFKDILSKKSKEERFAMLECLQYVEKKAGETIFKIDDVGELFYVILEGEVAINLPMLSESITWPAF